MKIIMLLEIRSFYHENVTKMAQNVPKTTTVNQNLCGMAIFGSFDRLKSNPNKKWIHFYNALTTKTLLEYLNGM